ncbi:MAG: D-Ala-D-Ala carboxypeptidase family metallohydrolase [Chloroflexi bacterium]|nr:D-Ala-D-Ala carboxypeptidase family metallohydrolase [Chloroflexota bacterium]
MKLSEHFSLDEFVDSQTATRNGIDNTPTPEIIKRLTELAGRLEWVRTVLGGNSIRISSGYRCRLLNQAVGGASDSAHVLGYAADFSCSGFGSPRQVATHLIKAGCGFDQIILEGVSDTAPDGVWVHISVDPKQRQQVLTMKRKGVATVYEKGLT